MARSRNIKPSIFKNEVLGTQDPFLTILFAGLWCLADREGRLEDRPLRIKAEIFPYRELPNFNGYLTELYTLGFIHRYSEGGVSIIQVVNFKKHQNPHKTERHSELPEFTDKSNSCAITVKEPLNNDGLTEAAVLIPDSLLLIPDSKKDKNTEVVNTPSLVVKNKKSSDLTKLTLPEWLNPKAFEAFVEHRKHIKKPLSELAAKLAIQDLDKIRKDGGNVGIAIRTSIVRGWSGLFMPKQEDINYKTHAERTQDYKDEQARKFYQPLLDATPEELAKWGLA